jgi:hypothetical protein
MCSGALKLLLLAFLANVVKTELSCKDMDGKDVDW